jgi:hypothetical protein
MTEKVVSLSGGLVLGMAFALFVSFSTTQSFNSPLQMDYPAMSQLTWLNDFQSFHSASSPSRDTTTSITVAPPQGGSEEGGRIIRIATVSETTDHELVAFVHSGDRNIQLPKASGMFHDPGGASSLRQAHVNHSSPASGQTSSHFIAGHTASHTANFTAIAGSSDAGGQAAGGSVQPPVIDGKPQTEGSPAIAQGNPGVSGDEGEEQPQPSMAAYEPRPTPSPNSLSNNQNRHPLTPYDPDPGNGGFEGGRTNGGGRVNGGGRTLEEAEGARQPR